ncbi:hypothetical protein GGS24DRAFT_286716 [Hypoxylon argillaceum]|nr:hypothetical protein GGS24DRAFT_286716 [Hypoxylon argillaceum]
MASQPKNHAQGQSLGPSPFRTIADHNPNIKRETPLLKRLLRETVKSMPSRPQTNTRRITTRRWQRVSSILRDFSDVEQLDSAVRVFSHLPSIPGLAGISPRVASQARIHLQIRLHYPGIAIWRRIDRVHPHGGPQTK